jgi:aspartyl protease family protein
MGMTTVTMHVANIARRHVSEAVDLIVDSGAVYSVIPAPLLERLGIEPLVEESFRLANSTRIVRRKGSALFRYGDKIGSADVIFGEPDDAALLGALTLEALGLALDPLKRVLRPMELLLLAAS